MFQYIDVNVFRENMTKYPNGLSIFEALSTVITSFNTYVKEINDKVAEGILETDAARTALSAELNDLFGVLREEYQGDFQGLQAEVDAAVDTINDKVSQAQLAVFSAQLAEKVQNEVDAVAPTIINKTPQFIPSWVDLLNRATVVNDKIVNNTGVEQAFGNFAHSDYIPIVAGEQYPVLLKDNAGNLSSGVQMVYFDSAKVFLGYKNNTLMPITWTAPVNAAFVIINFGKVYVADVYFKELQNVETKYSINWLEVNQDNLGDDVVGFLQTKSLEAFAPVTSHWYGKKANFKGDSITYGSYTPEGEASPTGRVVNRYCDLVGSALGLSLIRNYAVSGISISGTSTVNPTLAIVNTYAAMDNDADLIFIAGGTNDYGTNVPIGTMSDTTDISFYGALDVLCKGLITKYLGKKIIFMTPIHRINEYANSAGVTLAQYRQAIIDVCSKYGIPVIDGFSIGFPSLAHHATFKTAYVNDGLHPNVAGHVLLADNIAPRINSI